MVSLRRPSASIPKGVHSSQIQNGPRPPLPEGNAHKRKSKVGDKIKKRMSMRYVGNELFSTAPPFPGQTEFLSVDPYGGIDSVSVGKDTGETLYGQYDSLEHNNAIFNKSAYPNQPIEDRDHLADEAIRKRGTTGATETEEWDLQELRDEKLDVHAYVKKVLTGADEGEKKRFKAALLKEKQSNQKELQQTVFKHYAEFVTISKEISTLENDMLELKELLGQWKDLPQLMGMEDTLAPTLDKDGNLQRRRTTRNSIIDLQNLYRNQLTQLWSIVEGSQKYLPVVTGRHLVHEAHNFVELNAATYRPKQNVSLYVLSDAFMIASKRHRKGEGGERGKMVAERCCNFSDVSIGDIKDAGELVNAIKITRGKEYWYYRASKPEDKRVLLGAFKQVSQELNEKKRKDNEKEQERRKTMWLGSDKTTGNDGLSALGSPGRPLSTIGLSMIDSKDLRWIDEYGDELTMSIATRDWEEAVRLVEKGQALLKSVENTPTAHKLLSDRLTELSLPLIAQLSHDLSSPSLRKSSSARLIHLFVRLNQSDLARDTFLNGRREVMLKRVRGIKCDGEVSMYVNELAVVCFTVIKHTSEWYMNAFKEARMASGFVTWAKEQIETFADLWRRQVNTSNVEQEVIDECLHVTVTQNRKLLRDAGLDFTFLFSTLLHTDNNE
nr:exocyst complex component EXO84 [Cryptococcus depauperatus CBS 7841]